MGENGSNAAYGADDLARWVPEPDKRPGRTEFQRDRARVLHSAALRRLAGTTQVVSPGDRHLPRTRLTHSLECAQIGRELGGALGCDPDLMEAACLAHDLGHPPFGHNGEGLLDAFAASCGGFEGNAQSLRILARLEPKRFAADGTSVGLNLTRAALDAAVKYPWRRGGRPGTAKFGVYDDDLDVFRWLRAGAPAQVRCFEAQVMDWADDVAYSVHDLEDALLAGHVRPAALRDPGERLVLLALAAEHYAPAGTPAPALDAALDRLLALPYWPSDADPAGTPRGNAALKDATSQLIGRFCGAAEGATRERHGGVRRLTRYRAELVVPAGTVLECAVLKAVAAQYVMRRPDQRRRYAAQRELLAELAERLTRSAPEGLGLFRGAFEAAADDAARLRVVTDRIASLTDAEAVSLHGELGA
ncbi:deoxyguanosinetriphosphate triphosphohydrolase [Mangrovactinospora gilvigrisea]|uniref:Deoxyguanosinetriphosphate triphosphohydrolase n=1 Tax=Mangrovactinospora gilvigrisea TaxID=1428644 RepID=A0A1J7BCJ3_9ACTN|nr:deoxyguanosinetriphosphate triphosphohydrolase [Mangrovactinospora gilvigrisea]OIV36374.1 deoxyguanosinetriphosphate triphosphohydrolase [Mangrovactinospora gilvigrisea]